MEVKTTVKLLMFESNKFNITKTTAVRIYNTCEKIGTMDLEQDAHQLAVSIVQIIDNINELKAEIPKLMELFNNVEKVEKHVKKTPESEYKD